MQSLLILGRQPELGVAELESLYGSKKIRPIGENAAIVDVDPCLLAFDRLGGSVKFCKLLTVLDTIYWNKIEQFLIKVAPEQSKSMPEGKMTLGLSLYGFNKNPAEIMQSGIKIKKSVQKTGRSVRVVPTKENELSSAQIIHNGLTKPNGWDLVFILDGSKTYIAQTVKVQDIEAYTKRDRNRPKRDMRVGMLPPKLAQIIINLAVGKLPEDKLDPICDIPEGQPVPFKYLDQKILDPFCGTGVIIQEALLMGYSAYATDKEIKMVDYTKQNVGWLKNRYTISDDSSLYETADATSYGWPDDFDFVASETYLGRPLSRLPVAEELSKISSDCNLIIQKFLLNLGKRIKPGTRLCIAVPTWQVAPGKFKHLPLIDQISTLGYNHVSFGQSGSSLIYFREDQTVARELLVLTKE
jgi:tRNA G10  N-methylase Trm11